MSIAYGAAADAKARSAARAAVWIGPDGKVRAFWPKVDAKTFPQKLQEQLAAADRK